jgi:hypothetical protein
VFVALHSDAEDGNSQARYIWVHLCRYCLDKDEFDPPGDGVHPCFRGTKRFATAIAMAIQEWLDEQVR